MVIRNHPAHNRPNGEEDHKEADKRYAEVLHHGTGCRLTQAIR